jgi:hypothetical protein
VREEWKWKTDAELAPWGHDRDPTVWEGMCGRPGEAIKTVIGAAALSGFISLVATNWSEGAKLSSGQGTVLAIVVAPIIWWILMFAQIRGWISPTNLHDD